MKNLLIIPFLLSILSIHAQQDPLYSQYMLNPLVINPAYAGLTNDLNAMAMYRTQWTGLEGQPRTLAVSGHASIVNNKAGAGLLITQDRIGNISTTEINGAFAYKLAFKNAAFSFGMQAGLQNYRTDYSDLNIFDPSDNAFIGGERGSRINIGAGVALKSEKYLIGLSVPRLLPSRFKNGGQEFDLYNQHFYMFGAYIWYLTERVRFKPTTLLRMVKGAPVSADVGMNINFNGVHTAGLFTRNLETYGILVQTLINNQIRLGYVFELPTNSSVGSSFTTHELTLGILLPAFSFHERTLSNF
jgi:type IX secretion system PorP/SprF family membrane protein